MLNVGIISAWHVHTDGYADELVKSGKVCIKAMWDEDAQRGKKWAAARGADFVERYDDLLAREDIAAVICNSPTTMHPQLLEKAAAAKKHIFTEKLLATSTADCRRLCDAIEKAGVTFTISLPLRGDAKMLYARQLVEAGTLGKISAARFRRSHSGVSDSWLPDYWYDTSMTGGGAMMDLGAHPVYMLHFLFGTPRRIAGMTTNLFGTGGDENAVALMEFAGGVLATGETAFVTQGVPDILEIYGTEGSLFIRGDEVCLSTREGMRKIPAGELPAAKPSPLLQFVDACLEGTGTPAHLGLADALAMSRMMDAVYASDKEGKEVLL